jgi:hypothetical protein
MEILVDAGNYISLGMIALFATLFAMLFFSVALRLERIADRYRLKYGFDKDIERKEVSKKDNTEIDEVLGRRERRYKRRVFKD